MKKQSGHDTLSRAEKRHRAILDAALKLFLEKGYEAVSMDDIIRASGGSKATLYKQFGNKEGILEAVVDSMAQQMLDGIALPRFSEDEPRETLTQFGLHLCGLALSESAIRQHRLAVGNAGIFPKAARVWFEAGPNRVMNGLAEYLAKATAAGQLKVQEPHQTARMFAGMILFYHNMRRLIGMPSPRQAEVKSIVKEAVDIFLSKYLA